MSILSQIACTPCQPGEPPVSDEELAELHPHVPAWEIVREDGVRKLRNTFSFDEQHHLQDFVRRLTDLAKKEGHHPHVAVKNQEVTVTWWTHALRDLHPNDFIMAGKTDGLFTLAVVGQEGDMFTDEPLPTLAEVPRFRQIFSRRPGAEETGAGEESPGG